MDIKIKNDGKVRHDSWEARAVIKVNGSGDWAPVYVDLYGWGEDEASARENLRRQLAAVIARLQEQAGEG